jgi:hypothetical protein
MGLRRAAVLRAVYLMLSSLVVGGAFVGACARERVTAPPAAPAARETTTNAAALPVGSALPSAAPAPAVDPPAPAQTAAEAEPSADAPNDPKPPAAGRRELPRGGFTIFPQHRLVGFCGTPQAPKLGKLAGNLTARAKTIETYASQYAGDRKPLPVFELIAVVVQESPGKDGKSRRRVTEAVVDEYLKAARAARALLLLNIQPGHSDFLTETKAFEKYLREPDVGVALDPEWSMTTAKQTPGASFGRTNGKTINEVGAYLSSLVAANNLPEKVLVFHQVNSRVLRDENEITTHAGIVLIKSVDGLGHRNSKTKTYNALAHGMPSGVHAGFKLFFDEDTANHHRMMTPAEVLALTPTPEYVMYE